ncbi:uncharacterized protein [Diadema setosum]|uniref:uncharacterized protein n=1 Tax=Diadema setosum TaxID=31175 RepID=UPI003B3AFA0C
MAEEHPHIAPADTQRSDMSSRSRQSISAVNELDDEPTTSTLPTGEHNQPQSRHSPNNAAESAEKSRLDSILPGVFIRGNDVDLESDLVLSSDSDDLNGSEFNFATTTTEDEEFRYMPTEIIELRVLRRTARDRKDDQPRHHVHHRHQPKRSPQKAVEGSDFESEAREETGRTSVNQPNHEKHPANKLQVSASLNKCQAGTTTVDTEDDNEAAASRRLVKTRKKKIRGLPSRVTRGAMSETDDVDAARAFAARRAHHLARRTQRRASNAQLRSVDAETHFICSPIPFAIVTSSRTSRDSEEGRLIFRAEKDSVDSDAFDEGDVDDDHGNEKEDVEDEEDDNESMASSCDSRDVVFQTSSTSYSTATPVCRICFQPEEPGSVQYSLVSPCFCEGSVKYLHQSCVNRWIAESGTPSCELCGYRFHLRTLTVRNILHWRPITLSRWDRLHLALGIFSLLFVIVSLSYMLWVTVSPEPSAVLTRDSLASEVLFPIYACLDALTLCLCSYELSNTVKRLWRRWRAVNSCLVVLNKPRAQEMRTCADAPTGNTNEDFSNTTDHSRPTESTDRNVVAIDFPETLEKAVELRASDHENGDSACSSSRDILVSIEEEEGGGVAALDETNPLLSKSNADVDCVSMSTSDADPNTQQKSTLVFLNDAFGNDNRMCSTDESGSIV